MLTVGETSHAWHLAIAGSFRYFSVFTEANQSCRLRRVEALGYYYKACPPGVPAQLWIPRELDVSKTRLPCTSAAVMVSQEETPVPLW